MGRSTHGFPRRRLIESSSRRGKPPVRRRDRSALGSAGYGLAAFPDPQHRDRRDGGHCHGIPDQPPQWDAAVIDGRNRFRLICRAPPSGCSRGYGSGLISSSVEPSRTSTFSVKAATGSTNPVSHPSRMLQYRLRCGLSATEQCPRACQATRLHQRRHSGHQRRRIRRAVGGVISAAWHRRPHILCWSGRQRLPPDLRALPMATITGGTAHCSGFGESRRVLNRGERELVVTEVSGTGNDRDPLAGGVFEASRCSSEPGPEYANNITSTPWAANHWILRTIACSVSSSGSSTPWSWSGGYTETSKPGSPRSGKSAKRGTSDVRLDWPSSPAKKPPDPKTTS